MKYAELCRPVFKRVVAFDPALPANAWPEWIERVSFEEVVSQADCLSLHMPLTSTNHHLMDSVNIRKMKFGAILINVARGGLIDPAALNDALNSGHILTACLDVLETEPPSPDDPLLHNSRTMMSPHIAYLTRESVAAYAEVPAQNVVDVMKNERPRFSIPA